MKTPIIKSLLYGLTALLTFMLHSLAYAVVIGPNTIINTPVTYSNTTVDLNHGNFIVASGGSLTIENCDILATISPTNPNLIAVQLGSLNLTNNNVQITTNQVNATPKTEASYYAIRINRTASVSLIGNDFLVDKQFSVGLLTTSLLQPSKNVEISNNKFQNFHGVAYLLNSFNTNVNNNVFKLNSSGHVVLVGSQSNISNNSFYFSGLNQLGNAIDLIDSEQVTIAKNVVFTPTSLGIALTLSNNVVIDGNTITGGITYAINLLSNASLAKANGSVKNIIDQLSKKSFKHLVTNNISITNNYLGQNRYGIAATDVTNLIISDNFFTQRFEDSAARKFWTDNSVLLRNIVSLTWVNNIYKEAFTQVNGGDNSMTNFVMFPETGGVVL